MKAIITSIVVLTVTSQSFGQTVLPCNQSTFVELNSGPLLFCGPDIIGQAAAAMSSAALAGTQCAEECEDVNGVPFRCAKTGTGPVPLDAFTIDDIFVDPSTGQLCATGSFQGQVAVTCANCPRIIEA
ncbi:hypothetical protein [Engelhardtia mirabilis]|uniref:hypothetical protein n=1 Tax=Engelhardtia mirabilis TaxID=2528011 RepID=UPI00119FD650